MTGRREYRAPVGYAPTMDDLANCVQFIVSASLGLAEAEAQLASPDWIDSEHPHRTQWENRQGSPRETLAGAQNAAYHRGCRVTAEPLSVVAHGVRRNGSGRDGVGERSVVVTDGGDDARVGPRCLAAPNPTYSATRSALTARLCGQCFD